MLKVGKILRQSSIVSRIKNIILVFLLAVVCIGGVELATCRIMDPELYFRVTAPVKTLAVERFTHIQEAGQGLIDQLFSVETDQSKNPVFDQRNMEPSVWASLPNGGEAGLILKEQEGVELLTGGARDIVYFNQVDPQWANQPFGSDTIGPYGCGPTVMAMAVSSMGEQLVNPAQMALWAKENGYWAPRHGSYLSIVEGTAASYGLQAEVCENRSVSRLRQELSSGKLGVALVAKGHFTNGGHFILLIGVSLDGSILVADPSSRDRSLAMWDAQLIIDELSPNRNDGAPLWFLSSPNGEKIQ